MDINRDSLYYIFLEIVRLHHSRTHGLLEEIGMYPGQPPLLFLLNKRGGLSQKEIANTLGVQPSTVTVMLKRVEKGGLITRRQDEKDNRISRVYITDKGRELCEKAKKKTQVIDKECFGNLTQDEQIILRRLLLQMRENLFEANKKEKA